MPRFAHMIESGLKKKGHSVNVWTTHPFFWRIPIKPLRKWFGYIDQFLIFPIMAKQKIKREPSDTLFVFLDHALGPWIPLACKRAHVVHCHDLLAQYSAKGEPGFPKTKFSGKIYQRFIRKGFNKARNFICVSEKTKSDLLFFLKDAPSYCEVVYNGLNRGFIPATKDLARKSIAQEVNPLLLHGFIFHVGGDQWYKNKKGVIEGYNEWRKITRHPIPLVFAGRPLSEEMREEVYNSPYKQDIIVVENPSDEVLQQLYNAAEILFYPSVEEGFGWPIAEAQASGCVAVILNKPPMNEVGGSAAIYLDDYKSKGSGYEWAKHAAMKIEAYMDYDVEQKANIVEKGKCNVQRFSTKDAINKIEVVYKIVLNDYLETKNYE